MDLDTRDIVITHAKRTAIGSFCGSISSLSASQLGAIVISDLLSDSNINANEVSAVIAGQVLSGGCGQNPARQSSIGSGLSESVPAWLVNQVCGSGLRAVMMAQQSIIAGESDIVIAGGQESMSQSYHALYLRSGIKMGAANATDMMLVDGLIDAFSKEHMGITAENIAKKFLITRQEQDEFALLSQKRALKAQQDSKFKAEIVSVNIKTKSGEVVFDKDEFIRADADIDKLSKLKPAFKTDGTVTAGNASGINDGSAFVIVMSADRAKKLGLKPLAVIKSYACSGVDPQFMGTAPVGACKKALGKAGWSIKDLDLIESNEAFAAQAIYVNREMGWDIDKVNVNGGAIALGHPIGASGARVLVTLLHEMNRVGAKKGLATLCIGGGMGVAMCLESFN